MAQYAGQRNYGDIYQIPTTERAVNAIADKIYKEKQLAELQRRQDSKLLDDEYSAKRKPLDEEYWARCKPFDEEYLVKRKPFPKESNIMKPKSCVLVLYCSFFTAAVHRRAAFSHFTSCERSYNCQSPPGKNPEHHQLDGKFR